MKRVCGLDVHKDSIFCCISDENGVVFQEKFGVLTSELLRLVSCLQEYYTTEVAMESTSIYWMPIWRILDQYFPQKLVNPYFIRQLPGKKSDVKDAEWISTCLLKGLIRGSYVPSGLIQQLRQYDRRIFDLNKEIVRKLTKLDACLQRCNIRISNYISTTDSKSYQNIVRKLSIGISSAEELFKCIHTRTVNKWGKDIILASLTGVVTEVDVDIIGGYWEEVELAQKHKQKYHDRMLSICQEHFPKELERLQTIPGIKERSATSIIAELGTGMEAFETAAHLVSWAGLKPRNDESAGKIKGRRITHGNKYLRQTLVECAWAASRTKGCFYNKFSYTQVTVRRKNRMKVQVAIARKLLVAIWHVLHDRVNYKEYIDIDTSR